MNHSSIGNPKTVTAKLYAIMSAPGTIGKWHGPLSLMAKLRYEYEIEVTALSTYMSSIRIQLRDIFVDRGEELQGPRDEQPTDMGKGNFYRVRKLPKSEEDGQLSLL